MRDILLKLCNREDLTLEEAREAFATIMSGEASAAQVGGLLVGLAAKGTTVDELVGAATVMREKSVPVRCAPGASDGSAEAGHLLDTCGTGGDVRGTFNISTAAAIVAAAAGARVVKHGNRSASGRSGSADVLEALGVKIDVAPAVMNECIQSANICFAFARNHHPAMKFVADARKSLGIPTIFNLLGPLTNPGGARHQLLGVFAPELTDRIATVLRELGSTRAWVVHADDGLDEISTIGPTRVSELADGKVSTWKLDPRNYGFGYARLSDLQADTAQQSAGIIREILAGEKGPARDITVINAAAALVVSEQCRDLAHGIAEAAAAIDTGRADAVLVKLKLLTQ